MKAKRFLAILMMAAVASVAVVTSCKKEEEKDDARRDVFVKNSYTSVSLRATNAESGASLTSTSDGAAWVPANVKIEKEGKKELKITATFTAIPSMPPMTMTAVLTPSEYENATVSGINIAACYFSVASQPAVFMGTEGTVKGKVDNYIDSKKTDGKITINDNKEKIKLVISYEGTGLSVEIEIETR